MLKEKIVFKEGLPLLACIANISDYPIHFHDEMEVVYVMSGRVGLKNGYYNYVLNQGDIFLLNDREIHSFSSVDEDNMVLMLQLDLKFFSKYFSNLKNCFFVTDMKDADDDSLDNLRTLLSRIIFEVLSRENDYEQRAIEHASNFISCLVNEFQYFSMDDEGKFVNESKYKGNKILAERLKRITEYMYENYGRKLTLNEIADREHLSVFYLSHVIKSATGLSYQDLLSFMRVEESEKLLLGSDKKIGVISLETGFSAVRYYIKYFEKWFGMHPQDYREKFTGHVISREVKAKFVLADPDEIVQILKKQIKEVYSAFDKEDKLALDIVEFDIKNIETEKKIKNIKINLIPKCTMEALTKYTEEIISALMNIKVKEISVYSNPEQISISDLERLMASGVRVNLCLVDRDIKSGNSRITKEGILKIKKKLEHRSQISIEVVEEFPGNEKSNYMWDSLIMIPYLIERAISENGELRNFNSIVDDTDELVEVKGKVGLMTASLITKPSYYAYKMLSELDGNIVALGENYIISTPSKNKEKFEGLRILVFNSDERVKKMVDGQYPLEEVMQAVYQFRKSAEVVFKLRGLVGPLKIKRYKFTRENSILAFMEKLGFPSNLSIIEEQMFRWGATPSVEFGIINPSDTINIQSYLSGFSAEIIMIDK